MPYDKQHLLKELIAIVGVECVSADAEDAITYTSDAYSTVLTQQVLLPDFVVMPISTEQIQKIVKLANRDHVPIYPRSYGVNIAGSALPYQGGIVIDLKRMNRILEIDEDTMTATIEPGVTWDRLRIKAREKKLDIIPIGGPYQVSPIGNFLLTNITAYATKYCMDRAVTLEAILPNGEIIKTGSQCTQVGSELNPYFRYAYGPDITGLFRGSLGNFGIITRMVIRLRPMAEIEKNLHFGFDTLESAITAMQKIERLEITRTSMLANKDGSVRIILPPEQFKSKDERKKMASLLPEYALSAGIGGNAKQIALYSDMLLEEVSKNGGRSITIEDGQKQDWDEVLEGCSQKVVRMYQPYGSFGCIVGCAPVRAVPGMAETVKRLVEKHNMIDEIMGEPIQTELLIMPWDRCSTVYVEHDILYDPLNAEAVKKASRCLRECYTELFAKFGAVHTIPNQTFLRLMMPSYAKLLTGIKKLVDPNGIMLAGGPYSFELGER